MNGSNANVVSLLGKIAERLETLERIDKSVVGLSEKVHDLQQDVRGLRQDMVKGFGQVNGRIDQTNARLDNLLVFTGKSHADLAKRVTALERKVFKKSD